VTFVDTLTAFKHNEKESATKQFYMSVTALIFLTVIIH